MNRHIAITGLSLVSPFGFGREMLRLRLFQNAVAAPAILNFREGKKDAEGHSNLVKIERITP